MSWTFPYQIIAAQTDTSRDHPPECVFGHIALPSIATLQIRRAVADAFAVGLLAGLHGSADRLTLPVDLEVKQGLLEELDVRQRVRRLLEYLEAHPQKPAKPKLEPATNRKFPPEFSAN